MELNQAQQKAVMHLHGPMLVLAGAGSGKTRIVTHRIAHLLQLGILPSEILALTFTNKAAKEMRERVEKLQNASVLTCTFHSLGSRILRESIDRLGYGKRFTIYDEEDSEKLLKTCFPEAGIKEEKSLLRQIRSSISRAKNQLLHPNDPDLKKDPSLWPEGFLKIYPLYQEKLQHANAVDFDDLLFLTVRLLQNDPEILSLYQKRWLFLLIDEYQDTNFAQYSLTKLLTEKQKNLFAVGDPDQSIYSWRGAEIKNILHFQEDFPGAEIVTLEENYRSTNHILQAANALIQKNESRYEKNLWSAKGNGQKLGLFLGKTDREEAHFVIETLESNCFDHHLSFQDTAIFYRTNAQSRSFEDALLSKNIPYEIIGGISFYQRREVKDLLAYLRLFISPSDSIAFTRTINIPKRGIGPTTIQKIRTSSEKEGLPILAFLENCLKSENRFSAKQKNSLNEYVQAFHALKAFWQENPNVADLLQKAIEVFRYEDFLKEDPDTYEDRKENLSSLIGKAADWHEEFPEASLHDFLEEISLNRSTESPLEEKVKLMTLHNGKGLEFDLVFVVGMEEDVLPHINAKGHPELLEEERRLCYVGMTRAKKFLYLTAAYDRFLWGKSKRMDPSRFLMEIPKKFIENHSKTLEPSSFTRKSSDFLFSEGDWVVHSSFGRGIIQKAYHTSYGPTYDIYFKESDTERSLVAKYAKLSPLG